MEVATNVQILTSQPQQLTPDNITTAAEIVTRLLGSNPDEGVAVAAVATVSQLLSANFTDEGSVGSNATNSLTNQLENFSLRQKGNMSLLVQPNLVVQSVRGLETDSKGVEFIAQAGMSGQFVAQRISVNSSATQLNDNGTVRADVQIFLGLQPGKKNGPVGFVLYQNDQFFRSVNFRAPRDTTRRVISASMEDRELGLVEMRFKATRLSDAVLHDFACVFWNYTVQDWSTQGCWKDRKSNGGLGCTCNHTTNFAVLMSFRNKYRYAAELSWISILGCSLSITGVSITIIFHILTRKSRKANATLLLVSICSSLLAVYLLFLFGVNNAAPTPEKDNVLLLSDEHPERDRGGCTAVTALLQFFLLATFTWNALYATQIFLMIHRPLLRRARPFTIAALVTGWGLPAVIVAVTLGVTYRPQHPLGYRQEEFCWLAALDREKKCDLEKPMFWGFLLPVALLLLYNSVITMYFMVVTCRKDPKLKSTRVKSPMKKVLSSFSLSVILGLSWILGYLLMIGNETQNYIFSVVFCVFTSTQGLQIFILFTARTSAFKKMVSKVLPSIPTPEITLHHKKFRLWRHLKDSSPESYKPTEDQSSSQF
ncbi:adhesion G-protein coupled receptor G7 [Conger conger]|uniref:adhesion G-protein coupled receptor G7 n=1 Tax=Conger conger TaxID=82655 RepID=UPI002A5ADDF0|nr:adhesion G-protein coupled receptor G7 [Conger conger]